MQDSVHRWCAWRDYFIIVQGSKESSRKQFFLTYKEKLMKTITGYSTNLNLLIDLVGSSYVNTYIFIFIIFCFFEINVNFNAMSVGIFSVFYWR